MPADIHGQQFKNLRLMADRYAEAGFLVVAPDFFRGDSAPVGVPICLYAFSLGKIAPHTEA